MKQTASPVVTSIVGAYIGNEKSRQLTFCFIGGARPGVNDRGVEERLTYLSRMYVSSSRAHVCVLRAPLSLAPLSIISASETIVSRVRRIVTLFSLQNPPHPLRSKKQSRPLRSRIREPAKFLPSARDRGERGSIKTSSSHRVIVLTASSIYMSTGESSWSKSYRNRTRDGSLRGAASRGAKDKRRSGRFRGVRMARYAIASVEAYLNLLPPRQPGLLSGTDAAGRLTPLGR